MESLNKLAKFVALAVLCAGVAWASNPGVIQGVVKGADGKPVSGAYIKVIDSDGLTLLVVSGGQGKFSANNLKPGKYTVQAVGGEMQSKTAAVDVSASKPEAADLSLSEHRAPELAPGWPGTPGTVGGGEVWNKNPRPALPDGPGKEIAQQKCGQCHAYSWFLSIRATSRDEWAGLIDSMRSNIAAWNGKADDLSPEEVNTLTDYFWTKLKKPAVDPNSRLPRRLDTSAVRYISVDYKIPRIEPEPHEITVGSDGFGYAAEHNGGRIAKLDPSTNTFSEIAPPPGVSPRVRFVTIGKGKGDNLWLADAGANHRWLEYNVVTGAFRSFDIPQNLRGAPAVSNTIIEHPNGTVWLSSVFSNGMIGLDPKTGKWVLYESPAGKKSGKSVGPYGFSIDHKGDIWFGEYANNAIGRLDPQTGEIDDFPVPIPNAVPRKVTTDEQGNIWLALHETGQIVRIDPNHIEMGHPEQMKTFAPPEEHTGTYSLSADLKNGYIWASFQSMDRIARFDPKTDTWVEFSVPYPESDIRRVEVDQKNPNRVWWSGDLSGHFGYIEVLAP